MISNSLGTYVIEPGQTITFDGRASFDLDGGGIASYRWYENGSGSHSSTSATFVKTYYSYGTFALKLRVTDHENTYDEKTVTIQVRPSVAGTKYYITDHLGSVRSTVNHLGQVVGQEDFWSYGLTMPGRSWNNGNAYDRYKFTGHERDSEGGLDWDYMIARNYDPEIGRFMGVDPLFAARLNLSPYNYTQNNPILRIDPDGLTDYKYNADTGALEMVGDPNDDPDRILKTDSDGNVKRKGEGIFGFMVRKSKRGQAKVAIDGIAKGILEDGINFRDNDNVFAVNGENQATEGEFENFLLKFSDFIGKEIGGFALSNIGNVGISFMTTGKFIGNSSTRANAYGMKAFIVKYPDLVDNVNVRSAFHTHLSKFDHKARTSPSGHDQNFKTNQLQINNALRFYIITKGGNVDF